MFSNSFNPLLREVKSNSKNIKYHSSFIGFDAAYITPFEIITLSSSFLSGILFPDIIIDAIFSWLSLLWLLSSVEGGMHKIDRISLSAILVF